MTQHFSPVVTGPQRTTGSSKGRRLTQYESCGTADCNLYFASEEKTLEDNTLEELLSAPQEECSRQFITRIL